MTSPNTIIADMQAEIDALRKENEALLNNLRGKHSLTGATYTHLIKERDELIANQWSIAIGCALLAIERCKNASGQRRVIDRYVSANQCVVDVFNEIEYARLSRNAEHDKHANHPSNI